MNRISLAFVSSLAAACAAEGTSTPSPPHRAGVAPTEPALGVLTPRPAPDPTCAPPSSAMRQYGSLGEDGFRDVAIVPGGGVFVGGYQGGYQPAGGALVGSRGIVLAYNGTFLPRAMIDTQGTDSVESLAAAPDTGRVWMAVRTNGDLPEQTSYGDFDFVLADLAATGARIHARGNDGWPEYPRHIAAGAGFVVMAGDKDRSTPEGSTWISPFATVYDTTEPAPYLRWLLARPIHPIERYTAVDVAGDTIALAGAIATGTAQGAYVAARTSDADLLWQQQVTGTGGDAIAALRIVEGGDVVFASNEGGDLVVGRLDGATGSLRWSKRYGGPVDERAADLAVDATGRIFLTGDLDSSDGDDRDAFLLVLAEDGEPLVDEFWTSDGDDVPAAIALGECGKVVIVGETTGDLAGEARGGSDGFLIVTGVY